ncbi:hypothetical protein [Streptosporangium roseum]|uniref:Integral membrane protein n=1 Tax=Streptosporangium roseum (strain ATCC 12428 / DSM 43021 / JCM 3005 / KCTC 9067 / NCIMB 10171 / NRRL 2505 / NI 9100) TaxID=479432 RepID=D2AV45_STRRD|nr:hypothetical protein [Streptosporangium roseum]ACZ86907.1 hypothetical protein Sros_3999 [Streptosporangium roseum DSM 43021]
MQEVVTPPSAAQGRPVSAGLLYGLRILVTAQAVALVVAASFAGQAVQGGAELAETHVMVGMVVHLIALLQIVAAVLVWRPGRGAGWPALASLGLFLIGMGQHFSWEMLGTHVPSGLALFGLAVAVLIWAWSPRAAVRRS